MKIILRIFVLVAVLAFESWGSVLYAYPYTRSLAQLPIALGYEAGETRFGLYYLDAPGQLLGQPISFFLDYAFSDETEVNIKLHQGTAVVYGMKQRLFDYGGDDGITANAVAFGLKDFSSATSPSIFVMWSGDTGWLKLHYGASWQNPFGDARGGFVGGLGIPFILGSASMDYDGLHLNAGYQWFWGLDFLFFKDMEFSIAAAGLDNPGQLQLLLATNYCFNSVKGRYQHQNEDFSRIEEKLRQQEEEVRFMSFFVDEYLYRLEAEKPDKIYADLAASENAASRIPDVVTAEAVASLDVEAVRSGRLNALANHFSRSFDLVYQKKYYGAIGELLEAQKINPEEALTYKRLGSIYYTLGLYEKARDYFKEGLIRDPNDQQVQKMLIRANQKIIGSE